MVLIYGKNDYIMDTENVVIFVLKYVYVVRWSPEKDSKQQFIFGSYKMPNNELSFKCCSKIPRRIITTALGKAKYYVCNHYKHATGGRKQSFMFRLTKLARQEEMV